MTKRTIITIPDPVLREICAPIDTVDDETRALADDMLETMYDAPGIGLAASQIGILKRMFVAGCSQGRRTEGTDGFHQSEDRLVE